MAQIESKSQERGCKLNLISNLIKCKWNKHSNEQAGLSDGIELESSKTVGQNLLTSCKKFEQSISKPKPVCVHVINKWDSFKVQGWFNI